MDKMVVLRALAGKNNLVAATLQHFKAQKKYCSRIFRVQNIILKMTNFSGAAA
jgi:hypothetical protein